MLKIAGWLYALGFITLLLPNFYHWLAESHPLNLIVFWSVVGVLAVATVLVALVGRPR